MVTREDIGDNMLFAVYAFISNKNLPQTELTQLFWEALAPFAEEYLVGDIEVINEGSVVTIHFMP